VCPIFTVVEQIPILIKIFIPGGHFSYIDIVMVSIANEFLLQLTSYLRQSLYSLYGELKTKKLKN
jgi:hypothetical protein